MLGRSASSLVMHRPGWRPGAATKALVRKYRKMRGDVEYIQALKRKELLKRVKSKKDVKKPSLIVKKVDGEYIVQMEVTKVFSRERLPHQYPYEDKPPLIFNIGRTEQENQKRQQRRERLERREQRRKDRYVQSEFRDMCKDICLKSYQEAIGVLPKPNPNDPMCPCFPDKPDIVSLIADSCSCCDSSSTGSNTETDGDEWLIEFTPPIAKFNPDAERPTVVVSRESQYNYLDFRVKLIGKNGHPVPRFFIGPDGKEVCSDLGGFWGLDGTWLEIGRDGFVGPDGRWVPMTFIGPDGSAINAEDGIFTDAFGRTFKIGIDGYIGRDGKWIFYPPGPPPPYHRGGAKNTTSNESIWTCFDEITPAALASLKFRPHGADRIKLQERLGDLIRKTGSTNIKMPKGKVVPRFRKGKLVEIDSNMATKPTTSLITLKDVRGKSRNVNKSAFSSPARKEPTRGSRSPGKNAALYSDTINCKKSLNINTGTAPSQRSREKEGTSPTLSRGKGSSVKSSTFSRNKSPGATTGSSRSPKSVSPQLRGLNSGVSGMNGGYGAGISTEAYITNAETGDISERRALALKMIKNPRLLENKKICKLARMAADGRHISGLHKDCYGQAVGDCCAENGGLCAEIFKSSHPDGTEESASRNMSPGSLKRFSNTGEASPKKNSLSPASKTPRNKSPNSTKSMSPSTRSKSSKPKGQLVPSLLDSPVKGDPNISIRRAMALKMLKDKSINNEDKKICKLARMAADGRHISGHHKDCYGQAVGDCCAEQDGICTEIFAISHDQ